MDQAERASESERDLDRESSAPAGIAMPKRPPNPRWLTRSALVVAVASAAVIVYALARGTGADAVSGSLRAEQRETVPLGRRAVAVAEPGASLRWRVSRAGLAEIEQAAGSVFYRVDHGAAFTVTAAGAEISTRGGCATVDARAGAVSLTVYEGRVVVANAGGSVEVAAGERAIAAAGAAPRRVDGDPASPAFSTE